LNLTYIVKNERKLDVVIKQLAPTLNHQQILFIEGEVGAGKTTFVRHLLKILAELNSSNFFFHGSPTYQRENQYHFNEFNFIHFDFYQVENDSKIDLEDYLLDQCLIIEWPLENLKKRYQHEALFIKINVELEKRVIEISSQDNQWLQKIQSA
jgi:tRNA threonylcarbamoyl adenosine modification protein YjeE